MTDANPSPEKLTNEQAALREALATAERLYPGIGASLERDLTADRNREALRQYSKPSSVSNAEWENGLRTSVAQMLRSFCDQVDALIAARASPQVHPRGIDAPNFDAPARIRGIASQARALDEAEKLAARDAQWAAVTSEIDRLYKEFTEVPNIPKLPKLQAQLAWRLAAANAGVVGGERGHIRRLRDEIADEGG